MPRPRRPPQRLPEPRRPSDRRGPYFIERYGFKTYLPRPHPILDVIYIIIGCTLMYLAIFR